jgi:hypothetical protein
VGEPLRKTIPHCLAGFALEQIRVMKKDLAIKVERAAKEKAIEFAGRYLTVFVPAHNALYEALIKQKLRNYRGPVGDFAPAGLSKEDELLLRKRMVMPELLPVLNELNYFSSAFVSGVADEGTGFEIVGRSFCASVSSVYDVLSAHRSDPACRYIGNQSLQLYRVWSSRLSRAQLEALRDGLDTSLNQIRESEIRPIGDER